MGQNYRITGTAPLDPGVSTQERSHLSGFSCQREDSRGVHGVIGNFVSENTAVSGVC
jgi:hypothetical protein